MPQTPRIGHVTLTVNDLARMTAFYRDAIGLDVLSQDGTEAVLGAAVPLMVLRADPSARRAEAREAGLFHTAFLLPERADLGAWLLHASASRLPIAGAADHDVSEALYMSDPEGNGIEVYWDRPRDDWSWTGDTVKMGTYQLDLDGLAQEAGHWKGAPAGTTIGHIHMQVGALSAAEEFWTGLGAAITHRYPGGTFYGWDGYHHHIATNTWNSRGAAPRSFPATGLAEVEINIPGKPADMTDPWGTPVRVVG